jgi:hypothetical protein
MNTIFIKRHDDGTGSAIITCSDTGIQRIMGPFDDVLGDLYTMLKEEEFPGYENLIPLYDM